jgi:hypothetical protein
VWVWWGVWRVSGRVYEVIPSSGKDKRVSLGKVAESVVGGRVGARPWNNS